MYIAAKYNKFQNNVTVWERHSTGRREVKYPAPLYFYYSDPEGEHKDIWDNPISRLDFDTPDDMKAAKNAFKNAGISTFESDIMPEYKIIAQHYGEGSTPNPNITFYDIEVDYDPRRGFAGPQNPYAPISAVALYHRHSDKTVVLVVPPKSWAGKTKSDLPNTLDGKKFVTFCKDEKDLLLKFLKELRDTDIISGWNSEGYDDPYVYFRVEEVLGKKFTKRLNFNGCGYPRVIETEDDFRNKRTAVRFSGRTYLDMMLLVKKFDPRERASFALDSVAEDELDIQKVPYSGTLHQLYNNDFPLFVKYNLRDTVILKELDATLGYIDLAVLMAFDARGFVSDSLGTLKLSESAIVDYCHRELNVKVPDKNSDAVNEKFKGALVLDPITGGYEWIGSVDIASLYPSSIRSINISPDTLIAQFIENGIAQDGIMERSQTEFTAIYEDDRVETLTGEEWNETLRERNWSVSGHGTIFTLEKKGVIPAILSRWYFGRKESQASNSKFLEEVETAKKNGESEDRIAELQSKADYYDRVQKVKKIQLNSLYGATGNAYFRFYDIRLAMSTTLTGQKILMHMVRQTASLLDGEYTYPSPSTIYSDTDSVYFLTHGRDKEEAIKIADAVENRINKSFPTFMRKAFLCNSDYDGIIKCGREIVAERGIFVKKKYYVLRVVDNEGYSCDEMKVMGLAIKKTTLPKAQREKLTEFIERYLKGESWDDIKREVVSYRLDLQKGDPLDLGIPTGVKKVEYYTEMYNSGEKRIPGHVMASLLWNYCLKLYDDKASYPITSGDKIRIFKLKEPISGFKAIAIPVENTNVPVWFTDQFVDMIDPEAHTVRLIDKPLGVILEAVGIIVPTEKTVLVEDYFVY